MPDPNPSAPPEAPGEGSKPRQELKRPRHFLMTMIVVMGILALVMINSRLGNDPPLLAHELTQALEGNAIEEIRLWTNEQKADIKVLKDSEWVGRSGEVTRVYHFVDSDEMRQFKEAAELHSRGELAGG
ncbi:MAG: hypothetical protein ACYTFT_07525, partial [Planctomycetota bacterium]